MAAATAAISTSRIRSTTWKSSAANGPAQGFAGKIPYVFPLPDDETLAVLKEILLERKNSGDLEITANMNIYNYGMI